MTPAPSLIGELRDSLAEGMARVAKQFGDSGDGRAAVVERARMIEDILTRLWRELIAADDSGPAGLTLVATGGFGRATLFPYSDIDLLFLHADRGSEDTYKEAIRRFSQELWDLKLKLSPASRTLGECERDRKSV